MEYDYGGWELHYFDEAYNFRTYQFNLIKDFIKGKTAEVGPGTGDNISYYYNKTDSLYLFEPSKTVFDILKKNTSKYEKIKFFNTNFLNHEHKFDTIIYLDVLEHIYEDKKEFYNAFNKLNLGGHLIINVPAFNFLYSKFDKDFGHFKRYSKKDFNIFIKELSPQFTKLFYYDSIGFILILLSRVFFRSAHSDYSNIGKKVSIWNKLIPISKIIDKITFYKFGKSLLCVIKK